MANILINLGRPGIPDDDTVKTGEPVSDEVPAMADALNHLAMWRFTRDGYHPIQHDESVTPIEQQDPSGFGHTVRHVWRSHPRVTYIRLVIGYQADNAPTSEDCSIGARLVDHATDAAVDPDGVAGDGIIWSKAARTLPTEGLVRAEGFIVVDLRWPELIVDTGDELAEAYEYPSPPRPMLIGPDYRGNKLRLEVTFTNARGLWMVREEGFRTVVAQ